ncbi:MAG: hypothetical protein GY748_25990, partial [Planctomycetaceae bacterium]|nr:hypothetical protein [Planctomycetaceae bacterium]
MDGTRSAKKQKPPSVDDNGVHDDGIDDDDVCDNGMNQHEMLATLDSVIHDRQQLKEFAKALLRHRKRHPELEDLPFLSNVAAANTPYIINFAKRYIQALFDIVDVVEWDDALYDDSEDSHIEDGTEEDEVTQPMLLDPTQKLSMLGPQTSQPPLSHDPTSR